MTWKSACDHENGVVMRVLSVNVGRPRELEFHGSLVSTSILKSPVSGRVAVRTLNLDGDAQTDLSVHGGRAKAVYAYPREHYFYWQEKLGESFANGSFGENLTTEGVSEEEISLGDELEIGSAVFAVTQPRTPCFKLQFRFQREDMTKLFFASRRFGFYLSVLREGEIGAGDEIRVASRESNKVSVADMVRLFAGDVRDGELVDRALRVGTLPTKWQEMLRMRRAEW
jgi:MOSC domain-containing protein YiiM